MTWLIVAGALGAISITGGLFLRRLLGELVALRGQLTELRRQITGIDRQLRAQRAHVNILRQLLAEDGDTDTGGSSPPPQAAVVNGNDPAAGHGPEVRPPARRKRHLGLYLGGVAAALAAISGVVREIATAHRAQIVGAVTGAAMTAATVTVVTVQPWTDGIPQPPPAAAPSVSAPSTLAQHGTAPPQHPTDTPPPRDASPTTATPDATGSTSPSPTWGAPPPGTGREPTDVPIVPAVDRSPTGGASAEAVDGAMDDTGGESDSPPPEEGPAPSPELSQPPVDPPAEPPAVPEGPVEPELSVPPLLDVDGCQLGE